MLSFIAGLIFASTFAKTKSLALVTIEHSMYGLVLFAVGLGWWGERAGSASLAYWMKYESRHSFVERRYSEDMH